MSKKPDQQLNRLKQFVKQKGAQNNNNQSSQHTNRSKSNSFFSKFQTILKFKLLELQKYLRNPSNQHLIALSIFTCAATYFCYRMQSSFDRMREKVKYTKSLKQQQILKQKEYLNTMLSKSQFQSVPIGRDYEPKTNYKFQQQDQFNTMSQLLQVMKQDYEKGSPIPQQYKKVFFQTYPQYRQ